MKLHLPTRLRAAVLACITAVAALSGTVGTGTITTGVVAYTMVASQAAAAYHGDTHTFDGADNANFGANLPSDPTDITFNMENTGTSNWSNGFTYAGNVLIGADGATETGLCLNNGNAGQTLTLSGAVTGTGLISKKGAGQNNTLALTGNATAFTGNYVLDSTVAFTLRFGSGATAPATTAEAGIGGTGNITFKTNGNSTLSYNYASGNTVNITNTIVRESAATSKVTFGGGANYAVRNDADISQLTLNGGIVTFSGTTVLGNVTGDASGILGNGGSLTLNGTISLYAAIMNGGSVTLGENVKFDLSHLTADDGVYTIFDGTAVDLSSLTTANLLGTQAGYGYTFGADGTVTATMLCQNLTWTGGALTWQVGATIGDGTFAAGDIVNFTTADAAVTLGEDISSNQVNVAAGVEMTLSGAHTLTADEININGTLVMEDATLSSSALNLAGTLELHSGDNIASGTAIKNNGNAATVVVVGTELTANGLFAGYNGTIIVGDGTTIKMGSQTALGATGNTITVEKGAVLDINGKADHEYTFTLNGGSLVNTGSGIGTGSKQIKGLNVTADSVIGGTGQFGVIGSGYNPTTVNLNGHVLTKTGTNTFNMINTAVSAGTLRVEGGTLQLHNASGRTSSMNCDIVVAGGTLMTDTCTLTGNHTIKAEGAGGAVSHPDGHSLTVAGSLTVDAAAGSTLTMGTLTTDSLIKTGEGSLAMSGALTINKQLGMNYEGAVTLGNVSVADGAVLTYTTGSAESVMSLAASAITGNATIDIFALTLDQLQAGVNLGIAATDFDTAKLTVGGLSAGDYSFETKDDTVWLKATKVAESAWDKNWGSAVLAKSPATVTQLPITEDTYLSTKYEEAPVIAVQLTESETAHNVFGGVLNDGVTTAATITKDVWIDVTDGTYGLIVGGNNCVSWNTGSKQNFEGDTHIQLKGGTVGSVIGGHYKDGYGASLKGSSYISVMEGSTVTGAIVGGITSAHNETTTFTGDTNIFIYTVMGVGSSALEGLSADWIVGGSSWIANGWGGTQNLVGNTNVLIDVSDHTGEAATFGRSVTGGNWTNADSVTTQSLSGNSSVTVKGNATTTFSGWLIAGSRTAGVGSNTVSGDTNLTIDGGVYTGNLVGSFYQKAGSATATQNGTSNVTINGGNFSSRITGGAFSDGNATATKVGGVKLSVTGATTGANAEILGGSIKTSGNGTITMGDIAVTVTDSTVGSNIIGGSRIDGTGQVSCKATHGDILVTVTGGSTKDIFGGSYVQRNAGSDTHTQGNVTVALSNTTVGGDVFAGGAQINASKIASKSTTVEIGNGVTLTSGKTLSGGYKGRTNSTVEGARTLSITATEATDLSSVVVKDFDTVNVADAAGSVTIASITQSSGTNAITKTGAGTLTLGSGFTAASMTVSEGALDIASVTNLGGSLTLGNGGTLQTTTADAAMAVTGLTVNSGAIIAITGAAEGYTSPIKLLSGLTEAAISGLTFTEEEGSKYADISGIITVSGISSDYNRLQFSDGTLSLVSSAAPVDELTWLGDGGTWGGDDAEWTKDGSADPVPYTAGAIVTIGGESAPGGIITVSGAQTAKSVTVASDGYTVKRADSGTNSLTINGNLTVNEGVTFNLGFMPTVSAIVLNDNSVLDMSTAIPYIAADSGATGASFADMLAAVSGTGKVQMTGDVKVQLGGGSAAGQTSQTFATDFSVDGMLKLQNWQNDTTWTVAEGKTLDVTGDLWMSNKQTLSAAAGSTVNAGTLHVGMHEPGGEYKGIFTATDATVNVGHFIIEGSNNATAITITGGDVTITDGNAFALAGVTADAATVSVNGATIKTGADNDTTWNHASTLTDVTLAAAEDHSITVGGSGTTTLVGTLTNTGTATLDGTLDTTALTALNNSGELTITGDSVELKGSVLNNTGTLATTGVLTLTDAATVGGTVNTGSLSLTGANSFTAVTTGALTIADSLNVTGALTATSVTITNVSLTTTALTAGSFVGDSLALTVDKDAIATAMGTSATTLTLANITGLTAATINGGDSFKVGSREYTIGVDSGLVTITAEISDQFIWDATTEGSVWGDASSWEGDVQPTETSNVVFNGTGIADVTIAGNAVAGAVFVETTTNFITQTTGNVATGSVEVSAGTLTIDEGVTVVASGATSVVNETGNLIIKGALQTDTLAATGKDVQLSGTLTVDTEGAVNSIGGIGGDYGHLIVGTDAELTLLDVVEEKLTIAADSTVDELEVKHTGNLDAKGTFTVNSTADVAAGGVMTVAKDLTISDDLSNAGSITVGSAAAPATLATEDVTNSGTITVYNTMTSTGNVDNQTDATLDVKGNLTANTAGKTVTNAGNLQVGGTANATALTTTDGSTTTVKGNTTIAGALNNGGTLTVGTQAAPATLATGDVVNNGTITVFNTMTSTGDVTNNAGKTLDVKGNLTANTAGKTVNNEGTMTIGGVADVATLTTGDNATTTITGNATVATALTNEGSTTIGGTLTATNAAVTNEATGAGEKLTVTGALTADTLTTAAGATTEAKGGATLGSELANHGTTTITGDLASADATAPITITNDATGAGEKLTVTGNVTAKSLTTETGATTDITGTGKTVTLTDKLTNKGTTTIKGALTSADATATDPGSLNIENTGELSTGSLTADSLSGNGATTVTGNATMKKLNLGTTGSLTASGTVKTDSVSSTGGSVTADTLDLSGLSAAATIANVKADKITLSGFNMLKVTDSISNENGTGAAKVMLTLDDATMSTLSVGDEKVVVATDGSVAGQGITLGNIAAVNNALKAYGIKGAMVTTAAGELVMQVQDNSFVSQVATSENGIAGAEMVDAASAAGLATAGTALGDVYAALDACRTSGDTATGDRIAAAVTGSSIAAMGSALSGDVERQLKAIRNRTTTMGVNQAVINEGMPYVNAWVNAEGDYRKVAADGTMAGYKMMSWGGTVGMDVDFTPSFTCGLAATAMYGDFDADSTDHATGDLDTYYVSAFARYAKHRWTHTFVATVGMADTSLSRTIEGHTVKGDSDGMMFGGMYEVGYVFALDKEATTCLQPVLNVSYTHATLNGYDEDGANIALTAGDTEFNKLTVGAGLRLQSIIGENIYNRSSIFEGRAMLKFDAGDRQGETEVAFAGSGLPSHTTKSSETGALGAEFGIGVTVPVGGEGGNIFMDASAEIRAEYTNVNATVGYRVNF